MALTLDMKDEAAWHLVGIPTRILTTAKNS